VQVGSRHRATFVPFPRRAPLFVIGAGSTLISLTLPDRTARSNRVRVADSAQEPIPGLAALDRAAHRITPGLGRDGFSRQAHSLVTPPDTRWPDRG
jgi:hypothetical protein